MRQAIGGAILSVLLVWAGTPAHAHSGAETRSAHITSSIQPGPTAEWRWYYTNHFHSKQSCNNRGYAMTTPGHPGYVYGLTAYTCVLLSGDSQWSMTVMD